jgi:hypothetical protein
MKCRLWSIALVLVMSCATVFGQGTAQISGTVTDPTGALLPGVDVMATQTATGTVRSGVSNERGAYILPNLPIGPYQLEVSLPGFQTYVQTGIVLEVNATPVINVSLQVGQVAQTIEVQANAALVETRTVGVGQVMENERILELPLNGRNVTELIALSGAAVSTGESSSRSMPGQQAISVAGSQQGAVAYLLDGAPHNNWYDNLSLPLPFPDALGEFKVETSALQAQQGLRSGGNVNAVTRSGTNEFHGNAFWFVRNDLFGAREYGAERESTLKRNQYGGTIGGPVVQNKLFFFAGYQGEKVRTDPGTTEDWLPTPYALSTGDWSRMLAPECNAPVANLSPTLSAGAGGGPTGFVNNQINPANYNPVAVTLANQWLPIDQTDDCGRILYGNIIQDNNWQTVGRVDWQATDSHSVMGRILLTSAARPNPYRLTNNVLSSAVAGWDDLAESYTIGDTWLIDPTTVLSTRIAVNYSNVLREGAEFFSWDDVGVNNYYAYPDVDLFARMTADDGFTLGGCTTNPAPFKTFSASINSDLSLSRGDHQWGVGGYFNRLDSNGYANCNSSGNFDFDGAQTGWGLADFMIGRTNDFTQATPNTALSKKWVGAVYMADTWRVTPNVTLSYGVRWEPDYPETITNDRILQFSRSAFEAGTKSTVYLNAPAGFTFVGDSGFQGKSGRDTHVANFAPRVGLAWDVFGDGRTSLRTSAGIGYDYPDGQFHLWTSLNPPFGADVRVPFATLDDPWATFPGGRTHPVDLTDPNISFPQFARMQSMDNTVRSSQTQNWNLALQQQVGQDWLASATYMGSHTINLVQSAPGNPALYFPGVADASGVCQVTVPQGVTVGAGTYTLTGMNPGATCSTNGNVNNRRILNLIDPAEGSLVGALSITNTGGTSSYNGLLVSLQRRAATGININTNYTWSHCISPFHDSGWGGTGFNGDNVYPDPNNRDTTRGNCSQDRRHNFVLTTVARTPEFANPTTRAILSDWSLSVIYRVNSGSYLSLDNQGRDLARNGVNPTNQMAQVSGDVLSGAEGPDTQYFNLSNVTTPAIGTLGNAGANNVRGPMQWDFDVSLVRTFDLGETESLEFRVEAYNLTNSFRAGNPNTSVGNSQFGRIRGINSDDPRILQFALKLAF